MESLDKSFFSSALVVVVVEVEEEEEEEVEGSGCGGAVLEPDCQGDRRKRNAINLIVSPKRVLDLTESYVTG